ncbi:stalk domain-containing protein [Paenibacillus tuaregi]|uniref:stalk domain-containing protein n=1 Tax=Paenibacillus tuaregi TaxID=1816681 RepID=UPI000838313A|nr:stalk domain-containing protein [Paenibacillus tuaregi]
MKKKLVSVLTGALLYAALVLGPVHAAEALNSVSAGSEANAKAGSVPAVRLVMSGIAHPSGISVLSNGSLVITDSVRGRLTLWSAGRLTVLAGPSDAAPVSASTENHTDSGYYDGPVDKALFNRPTYTAVDSKGTVYISDTGNHVIRKIKAGRVYTLAGSGTAGYKDGKDEQAAFNAPAGLAVDSGDNLYVADTLNHVIRKVTPGGTVSTYAGLHDESGGYLDGITSKARFNEPMGLAFDGNGGLYVADSGNQLIRFIHSGTVTTYAGKPGTIDPQTGYVPGRYADGNREQAGFNRPRGLAYAKGTLFIADSLNHRIRAVRTDGHVITVAGKGTPGDSLGPVPEANFNEPTGIAFSSGTLYITDSLNHSVKALEADPLHLQPAQSDMDLLDELDLLPPGPDVQVWMDGAHLQMDGGASVFVTSTAVYVPVRQLFTGWGAGVKWAPAEQEVTVSKGTWSCKLRLGKPGIFSKNGTVYVEAEYLRSILGMQVVYDRDSNALVIKSWKV